MELNRAKISIPIIAMSLGNSYYTNPDVLLKMAFWIKQQEKVSSRMCCIDTSGCQKAVMQVHSYEGVEGEC